MKGSGIVDDKTKRETNADVIRRMDNNQLAEFLRDFELGDVDYAVAFCDLCRKKPLPNGDFYGYITTYGTNVIREN